MNDIPGDYYLNGLINTGDNIEFHNVAGVRYLRNTSGAMLYNGLSITDGSSYEKPCRNIKIIGGEFDSNPTEQWSAVNFFSLGYIHNLHIDGVIFRNCIRNHAIDLSACENVLIENCQFLGFSKEAKTKYGTTAYADQERNFSEAIQIDDNVPGTFTGGRLKGDPCVNVTIRNNIFSKNPNDETGLFGQGYGCAVGGHYAARNVRHHNRIVIENNRIEDCGFAGIRPFLWDDVKIIGNSFKNCRRNIYIWWLAATQNPSEAGRRYQISNNKFGDTVQEQILTQIFGNGYTGEYAKLEEIIVSHNIFGNAGVQAVLKLQGVNNCVVDNNIFDAAARFINVDYSSNVVISNNSGNSLEYEFLVSKNDLYDGVVGVTNGLLVIDNNVKNCKGGVIYLKKVEASVIQGNQFKNLANSANTSSIIAIEVSGLICKENTVILATTAVSANVCAVDIAEDCTDVVIGSIVTNARNPVKDRTSSADGIDFYKAKINKIEADNAKINALTVGADGSASRNLVVNGSVLIKETAQAKTPPLTENSTTLATTAWVKQINLGNLKNNGYQKLPSGLIIQWVTVNAQGATTGTTTLPVAFPNSVLVAVMTDTQGGVSQIHNIAWNKTTTSNTVVGWNASGDIGLFSIIAIGY